MSSFSLVSVNSLVLIILAISGGLLSPFTSFSRSGLDGDGMYVNFSRVSAAMIALYGNLFLALFVIALSETLVRLAIGKRFFFGAGNVLLHCAFVSSIFYFHRMFFSALDEHYSASSLAILCGALIVLLFEFFLTFLKHQSLRIFLPEWRIFLLDLHVLFSILIVNILYIKYDLFIAASTLFAATILFSLWLEWFVSNEHLMMSLQAEVFGVIQFALRDDVRRFPQLVEHEYRVSAIAGAIAGAQGVSPQKQRYLRICGLLHEAGTIETLKNPPQLGEYAKLDPEVMKRALQSRVHGAPTTGGIVLSGLRAYGPVDQVIVAHREQPDGNGFPYGLADDQISDDALLLCVANAFDVLTTVGVVDPKEEPLDLFADHDNSIYSPLSFKEALSYLQQHAGTSFSKRHVAAMERALIQRKFQPFPTMTAEKILASYDEFAEDIQSRRLAQGPFSYLLIKMFGLPDEAEPLAAYERMGGDLAGFHSVAVRSRRQTVLGKLLADKLQQHYHEKRRKQQRQIDQDLQDLFAPPNLEYPIDQDHF